VYPLRQLIAQHFPSLGKWQAIGLTLACIGLVLEKHCGLSRMAEALPQVGCANTVKQRLKRWVSNERIRVLPACYDWIAWVWSQWGMTRPVLLVDETKLNDRLGVMVVSLAYAGRAIPLVWRCYYADRAGEYPAQGQVLLVYGLLAHVLSALPATVRPLVQMDRGLAHSSAMLRALNALGVEYLVRVKASARFTSRRGRSLLLSQSVKPGDCFSIDGTLFARDHAVRGRVCLIWEAGQREAWCLFTNAKRWIGHRYALRCWQEESFRDLKSGGWQWEASRLSCPARMERLLLVMALAYGWMLSLGADLSHQPLPVQQRVCTRDEWRRFSLFRLGLRWFQSWLQVTPQSMRMALAFAPPASGRYA
jgi:hypothetical protein